MIQKAWSSIEEVPFCFSRSFVKFQGHMAHNIVDFDPNWTFLHTNSSLNSLMNFEMMHKASCSIEDVPNYLSGSSIKFQGHTGFKIDNLNPIWVRLLGRSRLLNPPDLPCLGWGGGGGWGCWVIGGGGWRGGGGGGDKLNFKHKVLYVHHCTSPYKRSRSKVKSQRLKPNLTFSGLQLQIKLQT